MPAQGGQSVHGLRWERHSFAEGTTPQLHAAAEGVTGPCIRALGSWHVKEGRVDSQEAMPCGKLAAKPRCRPTGDAKVCALSVRHDLGVGGSAIRVWWVWVRGLGTIKQRRHDFSTASRSSNS